MGTLKLIVGWLLLLIILFAFCFVCNFANLQSRAFWAPKYAKVDRDVFENSNSYVAGKIQDLSNYKRQYAAARSDDDRDIIESVIMEQFASFDSKLLPEDLRDFLKHIRGY